MKETQFIGIRTVVNILGYKIFIPKYRWLFSVKSWLKNIASMLLLIFAWCTYYSKLNLKRKKSPIFELQKISQTLTWNFILCSFKNKELNSLFLSLKHINIRDEKNTHADNHFFLSDIKIRLCYVHFTASLLRSCLMFIHCDSPSEPAKNYQAS